MHFTLKNSIIKKLILWFLTTPAQAFIIDGIHEKIYPTDSTQPINYSIHSPSHSHSHIAIARLENSHTFNPFLMYAPPSYDYELCYDSLFKENPFSYAQFTPSIASDVSYHQENKTVHINIHPQATFANQQPITASDAVASIEHLIHKGPLKYHHLSTYKLKFSATRPNLITIESKQTIPFSLLIQIGLLPITQKNSLNHPNPIESGPYQRDFYKKNAFHQLKKNRLYWKNTVQQAWSFPQFDTIKIIYVKSNSTALELFKRQDIDYLWEPTLEHWQNLQKLATKNPHLQLQSIPVQRPISMKGLAFNLYNPLFNNVKIRQALQLAFDFDGINQHLFNHTYQRINSYMTHTPYQQEQVNPPVYNLEKADQLLNESGWILDNGRRIHHKTRQPLTIHILVNNHHNEKISILYQNSLKNLGISASIQRSTQADYPQRIQQGNFDLAYYVISNTHLTCEKTIQHFIKSNNNHMNYANLFHSEDPTIKAKFQAMTQLTSWSEKQALLKQMDKHLIEQHYFIPFWYAPNDHIAHWDSIKGSQMSFQITPLNNFKHWKPHSQHSPEPQT